MVETDGGWSTLHALVLPEVALGRHAVARVLVLDGGHDLDLGAAARGLGTRGSRAAAANAARRTREGPEDAGALVAVAAALALRVVGLGEEHEHAPLLLHGPERLAVAAHDEADAVAGHREGAEVVPRAVQIDGHGADALLPDEVDVVDRVQALVLEAGDGDGQRVLVVLSEVDEIETKNTARNHLPKALDRSTNQVSTEDQLRLRSKTLKSEYVAVRKVP